VFSLLHNYALPHHFDEDSEVRIIVLYVNDLLLLAALLRIINKMKEELKGAFDVKDGGEVHWLLGLSITRDCPQQILEISQERYITDILRRFEMLKTNSLPTPMPTSLKWEKPDFPEVDIHLNQSMLGSLMYAMLWT
jgi:hypothetical protein